MKNFLLLFAIFATFIQPASAQENRYFAPPIFNVQSQAIPLSESFPEYLRQRGDFQKLKEITGNGRGVKVGVVDTGIDPDHRKGDLAGVVEAKDFTGSRYGWHDRNGHGSHVSGHIGARADSRGIEGIASECSIYHAKGLGDQGFGTETQLANAIDWLIEMDVDIISLSLGGSYSQIIEDAVRRAQAKGIIVFAALGNDGETRDGHPGNSKATLGVAAINYNRLIADFSSRSNQAIISGYGVNVVSCVLNGQYAAYSGTSMATPDQAGVAALLVSYMRKSNREINGNKAYWELVRKSVVDLGSPGWDREYGYGFLDVWDVINRNPIDASPVDPGPGDPTNPPCKPNPYENYTQVGEAVIGGKRFVLLEANR